MADIKALLKYILDTKGAYGARRVERAADEIPGLSRLYNDRALEDAFGGDNGKALMTMPPGDFEKYAHPIGDAGHSYTNPFTVSDTDVMTRDEYISALAEIPDYGGYKDVPFLQLAEPVDGYVPYIAGHEGRHRMRAMERLKEPQSLVVLYPRASIREPIPRHTQQEFIEGLRDYLQDRGAMTAKDIDDIKPRVVPETWDDDPATVIELPDIYAGGGRVRRGR